MNSSCDLEAIESIAGAVTAGKASFARLRRLLKVFRTYFDRLPLAYLLMDADNRVVHWNPAAEKVFGYTMSEALGRDCLELIVPVPVTDQIRDVQRRLRAGDMNAHSINQNRTRDGRTITCAWFNTPLGGPRDEFAGVVCLAQDVTALRIGARSSLGSSGLEGSRLRNNDRAVSINEGPTTFRVLIADGHAVIRAGLKTILQEDLTEVHFGEAWDASTTRNRFSQSEWDVVLLVLPMPGTEGLELLKELRSLRPLTPMIVLSAQSGDDYAARAFRAGASGYLSTTCMAVELGTAVRQVIAGHRFISPCQGGRVAGELDPRAKPSHTALSDREYLIMCEIGAGKAIKEIAANLGLSIKTVSTYRTRLLKKMRMTSNADIIRHVVEQHLP